MNFYQEQDRARRNTTVLVLLFILAVIGVLLAVDTLVYLLMQASANYNAARHPGRVALAMDPLATLVPVSLGVLLVIAVAMLYKTAQLSRGGDVIAEAMGGEWVHPDSNEPELRRLLNVVEEMAIASGTRVPRVYVIPDYSINAFAAGWGVNDAVIAVTAGTLKYLNRSELQGVIAHEFSHIFNGDMKLNLRVVGILYGILVIGYLGYFLLRSMRYSRGSSRNNGNATAVILGLGVGLVVIGFAGSFFGGLIKAMLGREREYLADASAVQFTRQSEGIAGALKKIGGHSSGSTLSAAGAAEYSHAYFAKGVHELFATHPPLDERIRRLDPHWDGEYPEPRLVEPVSDKPRQHAVSPRQVLSSAMVLEAIINTGQAQHIDPQQGQQLIQGLNPQLVNACRNPFDARLLAFALLMDQAGQQRQQQLQWLNEQLEVPERLRLRQMLTMLDAAGRRHYVTLIDLAMPSLEGMSAEQYTGFRQHCLTLINMDQRVDYREWLLINLLLYRLDLAKQHSKHPPVRIHHLHKVGPQLQTLFSFIAQAEHPGEADAAASAMKQGYDSLGLVADGLLTEVSPQDLTATMKTLAQLRPTLKAELLQACAKVIDHDHQVKVESFELIRLIAQRLDCPAPVLQF